MYLAFPVVYLIYAAVLFDIPARHFVRILLSPFFYFLSILAIITGYGLWEMKRWAWYAFVLVNILLVYENAVLVANFAESNHKFVAYLVSLFVIAAVIRRVSREVRVPWFLPKIRWWEVNPRYRLTSSVKLARKDGPAVDGEILDISMGGCFIKTRVDLIPDETILLQFSLFKHVIECSGTVVWRTQSAVTHPKGVGVKFQPLSKPQKRAMRAITSRLKRIGTLYRRARYLMSQEEFIKRLDELESAPEAAPKR